MVDAHPYLSTPTFLSRQDLEAFQVTAFEDAAGPIELAAYRGERSSVLAELQPKIDRTSERFLRQQFVELHAVRREVRYTTAGIEGLLVLAGRNLQPATNGESLRPIRRRTSLWLTTALTLSIGLAVLSFSLQGRSAYFTQLNQRLVLSWLLGSVLAVPPLGGVLRAWRHDRTPGAVRKIEIACGLLALAAAVAMPALAWSARPTVGEVAELVARRNLAGARSTVDALLETRGRTTENLEAEDAVRLAEADNRDTTAKLVVLDAVATRGGAKAGQAKADAHAIRIAALRQSIDAKSPAEAIALIDRWFGESWKGDAAVAEVRASADDLAEKQCGALACSFIQAAAAQDAAPTEYRVQRAHAVRTRLIDELTPPPTPPPGETLVTKVARLRRVATDAAVIAAAPSADADLVSKAQQAKAWSDGERAKVAAIGATEDVVAELYGAALSANAPQFLTIGNTRIFVATDANGVCRGLYVAGATKDARRVGDGQWTPAAILSQAVGHAATIKTPPPSAPVMAKWWDGSAVTARWKGGDLVELRIGDATP